MEAEANALLNVSPAPNSPDFSGFFGPFVGSLVDKYRKGCGAPLWQVHRTDKGFDAMRTRVSCSKPGCRTCLPSWVRRESDAIAQRLGRLTAEEIQARGRVVHGSRLTTKWSNVVLFPANPKDDPDGFREQAKRLMNLFDGGAMVVHPAGYCDDAPTQEPHAHVLGIASVWADGPDGIREDGPGRYREELSDGGIDRILYRALIPKNTHRTKGEPGDGPQGTMGIRSPVTWVGIYSYRNAGGGAHAMRPKHTARHCRACGEDIPFSEWVKSVPPFDPEDGKDVRVMTPEEYSGWREEDVIDKTDRSRWEHVRRGPGY